VTPVSAALASRDQTVEDKSRVLIIREDTFLKGEIRNGGRIEVFGYVEGDIAGDLLVVQPGGRCFGKVKVDAADVRGQLQGDILVRQLINIRGTGEVTGNVVVAPYQNSKIVDRVVGANKFDDPPGIFLAPHYDISGGGTSNLQFNSLALQNGLTAISNFVIGVMEK